MNNLNLSSQNVVVKLLKLPMVHSACTVLSVLYGDTKGKHPQVCELVENGMKAITSMVSPVIIRLEPQISMANDLACIGLDWLENTFPVVHKPTEQITASAKNMMHEAKDLMSIAGYGTVECVQSGISWAVGMMQAQVSDPHPDKKAAVRRQSPVKRAISAATLELDSALSLSEALVDRALPPTSADMEEDEDKTVEGFDLTVRSSFSVRLYSLTTKLCRRTYHVVWAKMHTVKDNWLGVMVEWKDHVQQLEEVLGSVSTSSFFTQQVLGSVSTSSIPVYKVQTGVTSTWSLHSLPLHLHQQAVCVLVYVSQMYNLFSPLSDQILPVGVQVSLDAAFTYLIHNISVNGLEEHISTSTSQVNKCRMRIKKPPVKIPAVGYNNGCKGKIHISELH